MGLGERYRAAVQPSEDGLPRRVMVLGPLLLVGVFTALLVATGITGSSSGQTFAATHGLSARDPQSVFGYPNTVRSDEWYVQTPLMISQVRQGLPQVNRGFPGGMDATVGNDLPTATWIMAFRPHLWGFLVLPLDNAMAMRWWLPPACVLALGYLFVVTLLPRRPGTSLLLAAGFSAAPFFQWWFLPVTFYPVAFALAVMAGSVWLSRRPSRGQAVLWGGLCGYLAVAVGMGTYVPYAIPCALVAAAFLFGVVLDRGEPAPSWLRRVARQVPLLLAGLAAVAVMGVWTLTRLGAIRAFADTVYPGARVTPPGTAASWDTARQILSAPATIDFSHTRLVRALAENPSEASTFFMLGFFLLPLVVWQVASRWRRSRRVDSVMVSCVVVALVMLAFDFVPGWGPLSAVLGLDRTTPPRIKIGLGLAAFVVAVLAMSRLDSQRAEHGGDDQDERVHVPAAPGWVVALVAAFALVVNVVVLVSISRSGWRPTPLVVGVAVALCLCLTLVAMGRFVAAALYFVALSAVSVIAVNPLYHGVYNLNETSVGRAVDRAEASATNAWVAIGSVPTQALVEAGVRSYAGVQTAPPALMWRQIDPDGSARQVWNRLASVFWVAGSGAPNPRRPADTRDQIRLTFDSCADFAQAQVGQVLSDVRLNQQCLRLEDETRLGRATFRIYRVVPDPRA